MSEELCHLCGKLIKELQPTWSGLEGRSHLWCALDKSGDAKKWEQGPKENSKSLE